MTSINPTHLEVSFTHVRCTDNVIRYTVYLGRREGRGELSYQTTGAELSLKVGPLLSYEEVFVQVSAITTSGEGQRSDSVHARPGEGSK